MTLENLIMHLQLNYYISILQYLHTGKRKNGYDILPYSNSPTSLPTLKFAVNKTKNSKQ